LNTAAQWRIGLATDAGPRSTNEDRIYADESRALFLVVDGIGGQAAGEKAAELAVEVISGEIDPSAGNLRGQVRRAISLANNEIFRVARERPEWHGMACVLTLAVIHEGMLTVGHVGDSRLYLVWDGTVRRLTSDHSPVGELEDQGELTELQAMLDPRRNEVFRDVGTRERGEEDADFIEVRELPFHSAAALLLCTDGLSGTLTSPEIGSVVEQFAGDASSIADKLVKAATESGGTDNVSVIFVAGPEFVGVYSTEMTDARKRHAITRALRGGSRWRRYLGRMAWLAAGILLGILLMAGVEHFHGSQTAPPPPSRGELPKSDSTPEGHRL
jgi:serine/threonine protein phosphatase PrpC